MVPSPVRAVYEFFRVIERDKVHVLREHIYTMGVSLAIRQSFREGKYEKEKDVSHSAGEASLAKPSSRSVAR